MASSSGTSSGSSLIQNSGSEENLQWLKWAQLKKENHQIITSINITQHYLNLESDNSILRAKASELSHRLDRQLLDPSNMFYLNQPISASADMFQY
ncbi:bZIP transcription factor family protein [Salix suchowensis]|nr:bZIP transcription factor family protein [Salix suchowensis]